jgi:hypothetical protein
MLALGLRLAPWSAPPDGAGDAPTAAAVAPCGSSSGSPAATAALDAAATLTSPTARCTSTAVKGQENNTDSEDDVEELLHY